ncbi:SRPBCC family protein [Parasphingorhabdus pacifica]
MGVGELRLSVQVGQAAETVWDAATDWPKQGEWMLGTEVFVLAGDGGAGSELAAFTGLRDVGFLDRMEIVEFRPPTRCRVRHTGALVSGTGGFDVIAHGPRAATFVWWERLELPTGAGLVWPVLRPAVRWGLRRSLNRFESWCGRYAEGV